MRNIPRALPENVVAQIQRGSWEMPPIFELIQTSGHVEEREMFTTFNMGIGMVLVMAPGDVAATIAHLKEQGVAAFELGAIVAGEGEARVELV